MIFNELKGAEPRFKEEYFKNMVPRFVNASLSLEGSKGDYSSEIEALDIYHNQDALEYALNPEIDGELNNKIMIDILERVTGGAYANFRNGKAEVIGSSVRRSRANMIPAHLSELLYEYRTDKEYIEDPFIREAKFHIRFLHIHPFGDGNGRTSRIILIKNLCYQGLAPCIITKDVKKDYCDYIENSDIESLAKLFKDRSSKEKRFMVELYKDLCNRGLIIGSKMNEEQALRYKDVTGKSLLPKDILDIDETQFPLRNIENLISLFKYRKLPKTVRCQLAYTPVQTKKIHIYDYFKDEITNDEAMYCEKTKSMIINLSEDDTFFKIFQEGESLKYYVKGTEVSYNLFDKMLKASISNKNIKQKQKTLK